MSNLRRTSLFLPWFVCGLGALFYSYEYFLRITPSVMTTELMTFFRINDGALGHLSAFYYYIYTPIQLIAGPLMDKYGPRKLLTVATLLCVIGTFLFALTNMLWMAETGRFLVGLGSGFAFVGVLKLATIWLPRKHFAMFAGLATALGMLGGITGVMLLTHLVNLLGWRETVFYSAAIGIIIAFLIAFFVRDTNPHSEEAFSAQGAHDLNLRQVFYALWQMMKVPQMWIIGVIGGLMYTPSSAFAEMWGIPFLKGAYHLSSEQAALGVSLVFIGWVIGGPIAGWLSDLIGRRNLPLLLGSVLSAFFMAVLLSNSGLTVAAIYTCLFFFGMFSSSQILVFAIARELTPHHLSASALAFTNMTVMLSGCLFQPLIGILLDMRWSGQLVNGVQYFTPMDYAVALVAIPAGLLLSAMLSSFVLRETYCKDKYSAAQEKDKLYSGSGVSST